MIERLSDGAPVLIRPIRADDKQRLADGLRRLSDESVQRRFLSPKPSLSHAELRYLTEVDGRDHVALVAESPADRARHLVAVGRFVRLADDPDAAGVKRFTATMAADNRPAHRLMAKLTSHLEQRHTGAGIDEVVLDLAA